MAKLVLFDMDGTLIDSQRMIVAAMDAAFGAHDLVTPSREKILSIVGLSLDRAMQALGGDAPDFPAGALADAYKAAFHKLRVSREHQEPLFPGALEVLDDLSRRTDLILGIATGKSQRGVRAVLELHGLQGRFATIQTADENPSKPDPGMVLAAMTETGVLPQDTVVVGDTSYDMEMARAAGASALGVSWGYHAPALLAAAGAEVLLGHFSELPDALDRCFGKREPA